MARPYYRKIRFLRNVGFSGKGYETRPTGMDHNAIYYYDEENRYCYLKKDSEGIDFEFIYDEEEKGIPMIHLDHPCYGVDITEALTPEGLEELKAQGYLELEEVRKKIYG